MRITQFLAAAVQSSTECLLILLPIFTASVRADGQRKLVQHQLDELCNAAVANILCADPSLIKSGACSLARGACMLDEHHKTHRHSLPWHLLTNTLTLGVGVATAPITGPSHAAAGLGTCTGQPAAGAVAGTE